MAKIQPAVKRLFLRDGVEIWYNATTFDCSEKGHGEYLQLGGPGPAGKPRESFDAGDGVESRVVPNLDPSPKKRLFAHLSHGHSMAIGHNLARQ